MIWKMHVRFLVYRLFAFKNTYNTATPITARPPYSTIWVSDRPVSVVKLAGAASASLERDHYGRTGVEISGGGCGHGVPFWMHMASHEYGSTR
jgi:hypothetical protein